MGMSDQVLRLHEQRTQRCRFIGHGSGLLENSFEGLNEVEQGALIVLG